MRRRRMFFLFGLICAALAGYPVHLGAATYTSTVTFNPSQGISWNYGWEQCVLDLPSGASVESVQVELRAKVWAWGSYPSRIDLLCSDTTTFYTDPDYTVCSLTTSTHPNPSNFYTRTCTLKQNQIGWLTNDQCIRFLLVVPLGGTFYLDYAKVTVTTSAPKVETPTFSPQPGLYNLPQSVSISCATAGATVRYTIDGNDPTPSSTIYSAPIQISATTTLKAKAFKTDWTPSDTASGTYLIEDGNETTLYLLDKGMLSTQMGDPIPWIAHYVNPGQSSQWETTLEGDIFNTFFYRINVVESREAARLRIEFLVDHSGDATTVATTELDIGVLPENYYSVYSGYINNIDLFTQDADKIIYRVTSISGTQPVAIGIDGTEDFNNSHIKIYYKGPVACLSISPQEWDVSTEFSFDASCSYDANYPSSQLQCRWDWESDGTYDTAYGVDKIASHQYSRSGIKAVKLQVKNPAGLSRTIRKEIPIDLVIANSFESPGPAPTGLAWDGSHLWLSDAHDKSISKLSTNGDVLSSCPSPCGDPLDLAWDGQFLWVIDAWGSDEVGNKLYKVDASCTGLGTLDVATDLSTGLAWDGHYLWAADGTNQRIAKLDPSTGEVLVSFASPGPSPRGLAWDGRYLWVADYSAKKIYQVDVNGTLINSYPAPEDGAPAGLTWDDESKTLWCVNLDNATLYQLTDQIPTTTSCSLSRTSLVLGENLAVFGKIEPPPGKPGLGISIEFIPPEGEPIKRATLANIDGEFVFDLPCGLITVGGTWRVRTSWVGDGPYAGSTSVEQTLQVAKAKATVTLNLASQAIKLGETVDISGKLTPQPDCGADLQGTRVWLHVTDPDGTAKAPTAMDVITPFGQYVLQDYAGFNLLGEWTVQAKFAGDQGYEPSESEVVRLRVVETAGYAVIVQGKIGSGEGLASHNKTANLVYTQLKQRGLLDADIKYFNYDTNQPGVDAIPTNAGIQDAITQWARDKMNGKPANLYIVMVDHGFVDTFYIEPETISAAELGGWLTTLQSSLTGQAAQQEVLVILGFCRSGSFINDLSGQHRVIIASAAENESSYKGPLDADGIREGEYFISEFFKSASYGKSVKTGFEESARLTGNFTSSGSGETNAPYFDDSWQHPLLDDDGDGVGSADLTNQVGDGVLSKDLFVGVSTITGNDPGDVAVGQVNPTVFLAEGATIANLWAKVNNNNRLDTLWVEVKPPGYAPVDPGGSEQPEIVIPRSVYDTYNSGLDRYEWTNQDGFSSPGTYQIFYFAKDVTSKNVSPLMETRLYKAKTGNSPPQAFALLSPAAGQTVLTRVILDWEDTTDPDGDQVTYTVLLSRGDPAFGNPIRKEGLTYSTALLGPADGIEDLSDYYWKVQAIDQYGAIRETGARIFHTNNTNPVAAWAKGHVYNGASGSSITNAEVSIGSVTLAAALGGYYLGEVPPGIYTVAASVTGCEPLSYSAVEFKDGAIVTQNFPMVCQVIPGDINGDLSIDLNDVILALQLMAGLETFSVPLGAADMNSDGKIGLEEALYVLQKAAGLR